MCKVVDGNGTRWITVAVADQVTAEEMVRKEYPSAKVESAAVSAQFIDFTHVAPGRMKDWGEGTILTTIF